MILRPYQSQMLDDVRQAMRAGVRRVLLQAPTGAGKTVVLASMMHGAEQRGKTCWLIVHRQELVDQSLAALRAAGCNPGTVAAGYPMRPGARVQVCSVQSLARRMGRLAMPDLIVTDEAHRCRAATYERIYDAYPRAYHIGLTATPERLDGKGLGKHFDRLILGPPAAWLIEQGYLSDYRLFSLPAVSMAGVHTVAGDYNKAEAAARMDGSRVVGDALGHYLKHCRGARAVVFAWSVKASIEIAEQFAAAGVPAAHLDGTTPKHERRQIIRDLEAGRILVLCNVDIVSEGFDLPAIEAAFLMRPTQSTRLHLQQVGRSLRPAAGKEYAMIYDHVGNTDRLDILPDDEIAWSLDGHSTGGKQDTEPSVRACGQCFAAGRPTDRVCRVCGYIFPIQEREVTIEAGELEEIDPKELRRQRNQEQARAASLEALQAVEKSRGYKPGWAKHVWQARQRRRQTA